MREMQLSMTVNSGVDFLVIKCQKISNLIHRLTIVAAGNRH
jgi:hypothetical protein